MKLPWNRPQKSKPPVPPRPKRKENDLFGTYIKVTPNHTTAELRAIQDWLKEQDGLTYISMPIADILGKAKRDGVTYVVIDIVGNINTPRGPYYKPHSDFRELTFAIQPRVENHFVAPTTVEVLGKTYDKKELKAALEKLESK
ncbi:hypothetical protein VPHD260_0181 [Vibrio phage D260]